MTPDKHPNSRPVTIFRNRTFMETAQTADVQSHLDSGSASIGAYFASPDSQVIGSGLSPTETKLLLPIHLYMHKDDQKFNEEVRRFYNSMETKVPVNGLTLETGLNTDNNKPVSADNLPISLIDFLRYRHAVGHPQVAMSKENASGNQLIRFYVFNPLEEEKKNELIADVRDKAMGLYLEVIRDKDEEKLNSMMLLLGEDYRTHASPQKKKEWLKAKSEKEPTKFVEAHSTNYFEDVVWLRKMNLTGVVKEINGALYVTSSQEPLGNSEQEALIVLRNPEKKELYNLLKGNVQEALKKQVKKAAMTPAAKPAVTAPAVAAGA